MINGKMWRALAIIFLLGMIYSLYDFNKRLESYQLYEGIPKDTSWGVDGLYFQGNNYYCVNTKDLSRDEAEETDYHENCHDLVYKDKKHFCN